jgi:hypothetical protein
VLNKPRIKARDAAPIDEPRRRCCVVAGSFLLCVVIMMLFVEMMIT